MIELKNATKKFDTYTAVDNVSLKIEKGSAYGLLGSNGAGKSTILRLLSGIYQNESGDVLIDGKTVYDNVETKKKVFFINDETIQFSNYTLKSLKNYYKSYYDNFSEEIFEKLQKLVNLPMNKKLNTFSKGMKRQAVVITGLACQPDYLLLDEAFDGLDPTMRHIVKNMIIDAMIDRELTAVISSHNLREIGEICDTAALLHNGKVIFAQNLENACSDVHKIQIALPPESDGTISKLSKEELENAGFEILHFEQTMSIYHIIVRSEPDALQKFFSAKNPVLYDNVPLTLEELFIYQMEVLGYDSNGIQSN